jgi:hypothetical protein
MYGFDFLDDEHPIIYVAGFISEDPERSFELRKWITKEINRMGILTYDPLFKGIFEIESEVVDLDKLRYDIDYRDKVVRTTGIDEIIKRDLAAIDRVDAVLAYYDKDVPIVGTLMEIFYTHRILGKPVAVWNIGKPDVSAIWIKGNVGFVERSFFRVQFWLYCALRLKYAASTFEYNISNR